tara:strand:- start:2088 stop:2684 length:597 start_codon:yes stop_codon:yes gene_type:complete
MLIGLVGLISSGKDTVANRLVTKHGYKRDSFADPLKDAVSKIFNWDRKLLEGNTSEGRKWREQPDAFWSKKMGKEVTPRLILQQFGTEVMRGQMYDGIWVDSLIARYKGKKTVVSDTRFQNEIKTIKAHGGVIVLVKRGPISTREEMQKQGIHQSEWDWVGSNFDYTIENTGTLEELNAEIDTTIHQLPNHQPSNEDA